MKRLEVWFQALKLPFPLTWCTNLMREVVLRIDFAQLLERGEGNGQAIYSLVHQDFCLTNFPGGLDGLAEAFRQFPEQPLIKEGLEILAEKFSDPDGCRHRPWGIIEMVLF